MIKIDWDNYTAIFAKMANEADHKEMTQKEKLLWLLERGYGISGIFSHYYPLSFGGYLSGPVRDLRNDGHKIGTFKADGEKSQTYFLQLEEDTPIISNVVGQTQLFNVRNLEAVS